MWGRSGNRCAFPECRTELTQDKNAVSSQYTLGEQAHIVGDKPKAARYKELMSDNARDGYHNRILLCPNHHREIDENEDDWPIDRLYRLKSEHELWVNQNLSSTTDTRKLAEEVAITAVIDSAVLCCKLKYWNEWTSNALSPDPNWPEELINNIRIFRHKVIATLWPEQYPEFMKAAKTLSILLHRGCNVFLKYAERNDQNIWWAVRFYRGEGFNPNYDKDVERYEKWLEECHEVIFEATKAANWFANVVRRDVNPMFFVEEGKFLITEGLFPDGSSKIYAPEYTDIEMRNLPASLSKNI